MKAASHSRDRPAAGTPEPDGLAQFTAGALAAQFGRRSRLAAQGLAALRSAQDDAMPAADDERFLVETYYAMVVALAAMAAIDASHDGRSTFGDLASAAPRQRRDVAAGWFRPPAEPCATGDATVFPLGPLGWWIDAWNNAIEKWLLDAIDQLAIGGVFRAEAAWPSDFSGQGDFFRLLYEDLVPQAERHRLGEYYTPDWLAAHVLDQVGYAGQRDQRLIDPTCGSGVFLIAAIRRLRAAEAQAPHGALEEPRRPAADCPATDPAVDPSIGPMPDGAPNGLPRGAPDSAPNDISPQEAAGDDARAGRWQRTVCRRILGNIGGLEIQPAAVLAARANYLIALGPLARWCDPRELPVLAWDAVLDVPSAAWSQAEPEGILTRAPGGESFDFVVGNPPWIAWDRLPDDYRTATDPLWRRYGLFSLSAREARYGGAKKDLCALVVLAAADRYLRPGGRLGMVVTQTLFQTKGAGDGFRRFQLGRDGVPLGVTRVDDLVAVRPFAGAANRPSVVVLRKGEPTTYPVPYVRWLPDAASTPPPPSADRSSPPRSDGAATAPGARLDLLEACPIAPNQPGSPWLILPRGVGRSVRAMLRPSDYRAQLGANSGGANGVYWLEPIARDGDRILVRNLAARGRCKVEPIEAWLEAELLHPLLLWSDVARFRARPSAAILMVQDAATRAGIAPDRMRADYPLAHAYLRRFEAVLRRRAALRRYQQNQPFYSMYNVGPATFAPIKVVWRRMDRTIRAAVVEPVDDPLLGRRTVVPQETCALVACDAADEAHYLCALLNSRPVHCVAAGHQIAGGKGFGTPGMLEFIGIGRFDPEDPRHRQLAELSRQAHAAARDDRPPRRANAAEWLDAIDRLAASLWGIPEVALAAMRA